MQLVLVMLRVSSSVRNPACLITQASQDKTNVRCYDESYAQIPRAWFISALCSVAADSPIATGSSPDGMVHSELK